MNCTNSKKNDESRGSFDVTFQPFSDDLLTIEWTISFNHYTVQSLIQKGLNFTLQHMFTLLVPSDLVINYCIYNCYFLLAVLAEKFQKCYLLAVEKIHCQFEHYFHLMLKMTCNLSLSQNIGKMGKMKPLGLLLAMALFACFHQKTFAFGGFNLFTDSGRAWLMFFYKS